MAAEKDGRYQNAGKVEQALCELKTVLSEKHAIESLTIVFAGARPGIGTTHAAFGISTFLTRHGYPALYQEEYDTDAVRLFMRNTKARPDGAGVFHIGSLHIRPYYGRTVKMPYRYFPIIIKDIGTAWQGQETLPEADFFVLVCGGKWWETARTLAASRYFLSRGRCILLFNHMSEDLRMKLPDDLKGVPCFYLPFFANPLKEDRDAAACFREIMTAGTGGMKTWERKKRRRGFWTRRPGS